MKKNFVISLPYFIPRQLQTRSPFRCQGWQRKEHHGVGGIAQLGEQQTEVDPKWKCLLKVPRSIRGAPILIFDTNDSTLSYYFLLWTGQLSHAACKW